MFAVAVRVADTDRKRAQSLTLVSTWSVAKRDNALFWNNENTLIVAWVCTALNERTSACSCALERLVIRTPSRMAVEPEALSPCSRRASASISGSIRQAASLPRT